MNNRTYNEITRNTGKTSKPQFRADAWIGSVGSQVGLFIENPLTPKQPYLVKQAETVRELHSFAQREGYRLAAR